MDEATSALDTETEEKIISNIKSNLSAKTIIMIAHRKSTIQDCDQIINLNNGKLKDNNENFSDCMRFYRISPSRTIN